MAEKIHSNILTENNGVLAEPLGDRGLSHIHPYNYPYDLITERRASHHKDNWLPRRDRTY
ncbi:hypothetical protein F6Y02_06595 (plasmid) [Bacillus megaterium]|jgi:hypothetical protein|nr:hypothetical protein [Priestia megaterium]NGY76129.1 hypothetical protein [Priestia megaterium]